MINSQVFDKRGFTLIEVLVGAAIIAIASTTIVVLISSSFRVSNKTTSIENVRQAGNSVLGQMQNQIQYAYGFKTMGNFDASGNPINATPTCSGDTVTHYDYLIIKLDSTTNRAFRCVDSLGKSGGMSVNDSNGTGPKDLIDTSQAVVTSCYFTCFQTFVNSPPVIGVIFTLQAQGNSVPEKDASLNFDTSFKMNNL